MCVCVCVCVCVSPSLSLSLSELTWKGGSSSMQFLTSVQRLLSESSSDGSVCIVRLCRMIGGDMATVKDENGAVSISISLSRDSCDCRGAWTLEKTSVCAFIRIL